jgi:predicted permease
MRLRYVFQRRHLDDEVAAELASHLEMLTERYVAAGMDPIEARRHATRQLGNTTLVREDVREMNSIRWLDTLVQDVRYAFRTFARNPSFVAVVVVTLALGIGANVAIFSVVHSVLLKPLPYVAPDELYSVDIVVAERREQIPSIPVSVQVYQEWRAAQTVFQGISAVRPWEANLTSDGDPERVGGARVSTNFFSLLGVSMARGRDFQVAEEQPGNERVVVISDALWRTRYGSDANALGRTILINGEPHTIVGVAPPSLLVPTGSRLHPMIPMAPRVDIWKPIAPTPAELKGESWDHGVLVRLPHDASLEQGRHQLEAMLNERLHREMPNVEAHASIQAVPIREIYSGKIRLRLLLILAASSLLLLTACASITNVFMARVASRAEDFATRVALGAGRWRILSQTLTEAVLLAAIGGAIAIVVAQYGARLFSAFGPDDLRQMADAPLNVTLLAFGLAVSLATGITCGVVPAWQAYRSDAAIELRESARSALGGRRAMRLRRILVGVETALATLLLASAALLLQSFSQVMRADRGYEVERVLAADVSLFGERYSTAAGRSAFYTTLIEKVRGVHGVSAAGAISNLPALSGAGDGASRTILYGTDPIMGKVALERPVASIRSVAGSYFAASGTSLRAGRLFADVEQSQVAIISQALADRLWPGEPASALIGRPIRQSNVANALVEIIGVAADTHPGSLDRNPVPIVYRPYRQWASGPMTLVVRTEQAPDLLMPAIRSEVKAMDPNLPITDMRTMQAIVSSTVAQRRFQMLMTAAFALVALLLGSVGVYGVVSYNVACRTRDIGLRMALGAERLDVARWIFSTGMRPVIAGLVVGLVAAIATATSLRSLLFGVAPTDPVSLIGVAATLLFTSGLACYLPARRAASLDPIVALRQA